MFSSVILDVAIGMSFVYLILSLIASVVQELLATMVAARSANLQRGMRSLLSGDSIEEGVTLVDSIYNHGLIRGLYQDPWKDYCGTPGRLERLLANLRLKLQYWVGVTPSVPIDKVSDQLLLPSYIPSRTFALAMIDLLNRDKLNGKEPMENIRDFLTAHHAEFQNNKAVEALLTLVLDAKGDAAKLQTHIENWFNDSMDRVSGWYKKYTHNVLLCVGLVIAIVFNVDSVRVAHTLWLDRDARQGIVDAASQYLERHPDRPAVVASSSGDATVSSLKTQMESTVHAINDVTGEELLPIGWKYSLAQYKYGFHDHPGATLLMMLARLGGWLITAAALSLGASFWFDTLNKFMVVRNTIKPQEKSQSEGSKD